MAEEPLHDQRTQILSGVVKTLLDDLRSGAGDRDRRRQVEEWMRTLAEKYPEFKIETGLRDYYLAEAERLRGDFVKSAEMGERLAAGCAARARGRTGLRRPAGRGGNLGVTRRKAGDPLPTERIASAGRGFLAALG